MLLLLLLLLFVRPAVDAVVLPTAGLLRPLSCRPSTPRFARKMLYEWSTLDRGAGAAAPPAPAAITAVLRMGCAVPHASQADALGSVLWRVHSSQSHPSPSLLPVETKVEEPHPLVEPP